MGHAKFSDTTSSGTSDPRTMAFATDADIDTFLAFTGTGDREKARIFIHQSNGDVGTGVDAYFENPSRFDHYNTKYDESAFHADRYGDQQQQGQTQFTIHPEDDHTASLNPQYSHAPTGPPSRSNTPQEEGYIGTAQGVSFQKATHNNHDLSKWSLTTVGQNNPTTTEIWPDVTPPERERMPGQPCFVKPHSDADLLPSLLTILGSVPAMRQALACYDQVGQDYGFQPDWWSGASIPETIVEASAQDDGTDASNNMRQEFIFEMQRIMGSLLASTRSYISAEALFKTRQMAQRFPDVAIETNTVHLAIAWEDAAAAVSKSREKTRNMFSTYVGQQDGDAINLERCDEFELPIRSDGSQKSLYDVIDDSIWINDIDGTAEESFYIAEAGNVLIFQMKQKDSSKRGLDIDIPSHLFIDRYMKENAMLMKQIRQAGLERKLRLETLEKKKEKLRTFRWSGSTVKSNSSSELISHAIRIFERDPLISKDVTSTPVEQSGHELVSGLKVLQANIDARVSAIETQQQKLLSELQQIKDIFKGLEISPIGSDGAEAQVAPDSLEAALQSRPRYGYTLRGAATDLSTTYFIQNADASATEDPTNPIVQDGLDEWYTVSYYSNPSFECRRDIGGTALTEIRESSRNVMLVYVRDAFEAEHDERSQQQSQQQMSDANEHQSRSQAEVDRWPEGLKIFVQKDNEAFANELQTWQQNQNQELPMYVDGIDPDQFNQYASQQGSGEISMGDTQSAVNNSQLPESTWN